MRGLGVVLATLTFGLLGGGAALAPEPGLAEAAGVDRDNDTLFAGKTQPAPGRAAKIAPVVLHPVEEVRVALGDRVKKGQPLVKHDDDEPQADVRAKKAALAELRASLARLKEEPRKEEQEEVRHSLTALKLCTEEARHILDRLEPLWRKGSIGDQRYHEARYALARCQADEAAAAARLTRLLKRPFEREVAELEARIAAAGENLKGAEAELEHYTITAAIDGVVTSLDVVPGAVARPGTVVWGEILDLSILDVRCDLAPHEADLLRVGQPAEVLNHSRGSGLAGKVVFVGLAADQRTGRVPVLIRLDNADGRLRCYVDVKVRFSR